MSPGRWRASVNAAFGSFKTSHVATCPDVAPECATLDIPAHMHHVRLNLTHYEIDASYGVHDRMQLSLRLPYDVKAQRVRYTTLDGAPYAPPYGDIHHRTESLTGVSDATLLLEWSRRTDWIFGAGTTIPIGHTVPDPIVLGREGKTHEHVQFGSGTLRPILSAQWTRPVLSATLAARAETTLSLYENNRGFRAPSTIVWSAGPSFRAGQISIAPRLNGQYQTVGRWSGEIDENSGFNAGGAVLQFSVPVKNLTLIPSVYRELWSHGQHGETFHQSTTWSIGVTRTF